LATDEDTKIPRCPDARVQGVQDALAAGLDLVDAGVVIGDPAERLLRRRDVVAVGGEDDDGRVDVAQIDMGALGEVGLTAAEAVADEQVLDDPGDLVGGHVVEAAPPALEADETRDLGVDAVPEVVVLLPPGVAGLRRSKLNTRLAPSNMPLPRSESMCTVLAPPTRPPR
jgi:hypothetical protein